MSKRKKIRLKDCECERPGIKAFGSRTRCSKCGGKITLSPEVHAEMDYWENVVIPEVQKQLDAKGTGVYLEPQEGVEGKEQLLRLSINDGAVDNAEWIDDE